MKTCVPGEEPGAEHEAGPSAHAPGPSARTPGPSAHAPAAGPGYGTAPENGAGETRPRQEDAPARSRRGRTRGRGPRPFGLRTRLVFAFLLVAAVGCGTTAALTYRAARSAILEQTQNTAVSAFRQQVEDLNISLPLDEGSLRDRLLHIARQGKPRPWRVYAEYGTLRVSSTDRPTSSVLTPELRARVHARETTPHTGFQRVVTNGTPYLTIAVPAVFLTQVGGEPQPTGLVLYAVMELREDEANIEALVTAARDGALPALAIALIPALIAARGVLRPVRELRHAAASMGRGRLDTRIHAKGSDELADLARTFNESAAELERSVTELRRAEARARRFASDVSHELRTPLAGMLAVTEVLDEDAGSLDSDTARAVRLISAETVKLAVLVEDLMEISRFDARAAELHTDEVDVADCVRKTLSGRHWTDPEQVHAVLGEGIRARLDPRRFDVVVANLVGNALRHGRAPVTVRVHADGGSTLVVQVSDRGPGIHPDVLPHVFERFYKADPARARSAGSGLGLAITEENVRLHGGTVEAGNHPAGGAVFTVRIPL
ncbi:sensor histidine kinase [Streptomyces roseolus]|uniref:sensor histidine kinase n=1 Tax=Streptomyces roseolus TaxID=67358 RepID=UPI0019C17398|nr:two-component sensor histidine kinase [Streptomyces roseolus]